MIGLDLPDSYLVIRGLWEAGLTFARSGSLASFLFPFPITLTLYSKTVVLSTVLPYFLNFFEIF